MKFAVLVLSAAFAPAIAPVVGAQSSDARAALVTVNVTPATVTVGEPFTVRVRVRAPKVATITFPDVPSPTGGVDPVDPRSIAEGPAGDVLDRTAVYSFVAWDVGPQAPALGPVVVAVAGQERLFPVNGAGVIVRSLLPTDTTERTPRDLRAPVPLPGKRWQFLVIGVTFAALVAWLWWRRRTRLRRVGDATEPDPWVRAREAFSALDSLALADAGEPGRHVIAHVDVLREYLGRRFPELKASCDAATFVALLGTFDVSLPAQRIESLVRRDGAVRFAQATVTADEAAELSGEARDIVAQLQLAHEARQRAIERPPRPKRR